MKKKVKISDICIKETGIAYKSQDFAERNIGTPVVLLRDFDHPAYTEKDLINLNNYQKHVWVNRGDILISKTADIKLCLWEGKRSVLNQNAMKLSLTSDENVDKKYLLYFLANNLEHIKRRLAGATIRFVREREIMNMEILLPPLSEQKRIVEILEKADELCKKRQEADELSNRTIHSIFLEMFGDPIKNEKRWVIKRVNDIVINKPNNGYFAKNEEYSDYGKPIIWISDFIDKFYVDCSNLKKVNIKDADIEKYKVKYGDILFCRSSLNVEGIGKTGIVPRDLPLDTIFECHIIRISLDIKLIIPEFFRAFSNTKFFRDQIMKDAQIATMTTISQRDILNKYVIVPPLELQQKFVDSVQRVKKIKKVQQKSKKEIDTLFSAFMQKAFQG